MSSITLLFIDEENVNFDLLEKYIFKSSLKDEIKLIKQYPLQTIDEMIEHILSINPDIIVSDYNLNDKKESIKYNVPYTGVKLIESFQEIRQGFPCVVLTNYDEKAVPESIDVNKVYVKDILIKEEDKTHFTFLERLKSQHENYIKRVNSAEEEFNKLTDKFNSNKKLTLQEEESLIKLDSFLEKSIDSRNLVPEDLKKLSHQDYLMKILSQVDKIIEEIKSDDEVHPTTTSQNL